MKFQKPISSLIFEDFSGNEINLKDYHGKLVIMNFWATWCAPCKKEMPSLDMLFQDKNFENLQVFAVNMEQPNPLKTKKFFTDLNIQKLEIFFDSNLNFVKEFKLKGMPTTVLINKKGEEFARIIGEVNFQNAKFFKMVIKNMTSYILEAISVPPLSKDKPKQAVILCHGYGGDGKDISALAINWQRFLPDAIFCVPMHLKFVLLIHKVFNGLI